MREIKIRYTYKRKEDGKLWQQIVPIESLESHGDLVDMYNNRFWDVVARDLFTGLHDTSKEEIYEGDILSCLEPGQIRRNKEVIYDSSLACFAFRPTGGFELQLGHEFAYEVIGNRHENTELLGTKNET